MQCGAVFTSVVHCASVLQCLAVCCSVPALQCVALCLCRSVLQCACVVVCCNVLQCRLQPRTELLFRHTCDMTHSRATNTLQHIATHCNTLQHVATHCNTLHHIATHCNTLQHTATRCLTLQQVSPNVTCQDLHLLHQGLPLPDPRYFYLRLHTYKFSCFSNFSSDAGVWGGSTLPPSTGGI